MKIQEVLLETAERPYVCVHAKKGKHECTASSSYEAAKKAAEKWGLKSTAGIDAYVADKPVSTASLEEAYDPFADDEEDFAEPQTKIKNIVAQLEDAQDFDGNKEINFENGDKRKLPLKVIEIFLSTYDGVKDKAQMTADASVGFEEFIQTIKNAAAGRYGKAQKSPYQGMAGSRSGGPTYYN